MNEKFVVDSRIKIKNIKNISKACVYYKIRNEFERVRNCDLGLLTQVEK